MYLQLGNFVFEKGYSPDTINHSDETSYAEHALINLKPRLQPTGNNLEEIEISIRLRSEIINVNETLLAIKKSKDEFEVLPFLYGTGIYKGDYIITKIDHSPVYTLDDGFTVELSLNITLKEYQVPDKLQQQQNTARKSAFAVGDKQPVRLAPIDSYTPAQLTAKDLSSAYSKAAITDNNVRAFQNNVSQRKTLADKIQNALADMDKKLDSANESLNNITILDDISAITSRIAGVKNAISNFTFPVTDISQLVDNNRDMQAAVRNLKKGSFQITNLIITRRA